MRLYGRWYRHSVCLLLFKSLDAGNPALAAVHFFFFLIGKTGLTYGDMESMKVVSEAVDIDILGWR